MNKKILLVVVTQIIIMCLFAALYVAHKTKRDYVMHESADKNAMHAADEHTHAHEEYSVPEGVNAPVVTMRADKDSVSGYNVFLQTENFVFSPDQAGGEHVEGQGHAHLYVDGHKVARLYSNAHHLDGKYLKNKKEIRVVLTTNDHKTYWAQGEEVGDTVDITIQ